MKKYLLIMYYVIYYKEEYIIMSKTKRIPNLFTERQCAVCKKSIIIPYTNLYTYKSLKYGKMNWFCSYKCFRKGV